VGGHRHDRNRGRRCISFQGLRRLPAVHFRQGEVHQDEARFQRPGHGDRLAAVGSELAAKSSRAQHLEGHPLHRGVVFDNEDQVIHAAAPCTLLWPSSWRTALVRPAGSIVPLATKRWTLSPNVIASSAVNSFALTIMTGIAAVSGRARSLAAVSNPLIPGIIRSSSTRSGAVCAIMAIASSPLFATRTSACSSVR